MPESNGQRHRRLRVLSRETKWEIFLQVTTGELSQADAARKWAIDVSTVIGIRRTVKDAALAALARKPGRPAKERDWALEAARSEIGQLTKPSRPRPSSSSSSGEKPAGADRSAPGASPRRGQGADPQDRRRGGGRRLRPPLGLCAVGRVRRPGAPLAGPDARRRHPRRPGAGRSPGARHLARRGRGHPGRRRGVGDGGPQPPQARPPGLLHRAGLGVALHVLARLGCSRAGSARAAGPPADAAQALARLAAVATQPDLGMGT